MSDESELSEGGIDWQDKCKFYREEWQQINKAKTAADEDRKKAILDLEEKQKEVERWKPVAERLVIEQYRPVPRNSNDDDSWALLLLLLGGSCGALLAVSATAAQPPSFLFYKATNLNFCRSPET